MADAEMPKSGGFRMFELFLEELTEQTHLFILHLEKLEKNYSPQTLESILASIRSIKGGAAIIALNLLKDLGRVLECYFSEKLKVNKPIPDNDFALLKKITHFFQDLTLVSAKDLREYLNDRNYEIGEWIKHLNSLIERGPCKEETSDEGAGKKGLIDLLDVDSVAEFCEDLKSTTIALNEELLKYEEDPSQVNLDKLIQKFHYVENNARPIQLYTLMHLAERCRYFFESLKKHKIEPDVPSIEYIFACIDYLLKIATAIPARFSQVYKESEGDAQKTIQILDKLLEETASRKRTQGEVPQSQDKTMLDLFKIELESQVKILNEGILVLETDPNHKEIIERLMRAAHSIKGAARIIKLDPIVRISHLLEDCFVNVQKNKTAFNPVKIDLLLQGADFFASLAQVPQEQISDWVFAQESKIKQLMQQLSGICKEEPFSFTTQEEPSVIPTESPVEKYVEIVPPEKPKASEGERIIRIAAGSLNRLMGLAGESMVETHWLYPFGDSLQRLKNEQMAISKDIDQLRETFKATELTFEAGESFNELIQKTNSCRQNLTDRLSELDLFITRHSSLSDRLYSEVIESRMRPFSDGVQGFARLVRDLAKQMNKKVKLEIVGRTTPVDRDILEKLEGPLTHLIRNAIDHGIESPEERVARGKPAQGIITLEAEHRAGMLVITLSDDGKGLDLESLRQEIINKNLSSPQLAAKLTDRELIEFLFLPGFSTSKQVTEISGRGIGLDVVRRAAIEVGGTVSLEVQPKYGIRVQLKLPLTLSVIRALLVEIGQEPYAFPLSRIERSLSVESASISVIDNRQYFVYEGKNVGLIYAGEVLGVSESLPSNHLISVVLIRSHDAYYGLVVDSFLGERELVVQEFNTLLGKIPDISSGAFMEDGNPLLIIDVEDLVNSIDQMVSGGPIHQLSYKKGLSAYAGHRRILVIDDSITVREVIARLLRSQGYEVDTAVNGVDGWNALRRNKYELVITDIDMPRMDGIEFIKLMRADARYQELPIIVISYKERDLDRAQATQAGANVYLSKSHFSDEMLLRLVYQLIGKSKMAEA